MISNFSSLRYHDDDNNENLMPNFTFYEERKHAVRNSTPGTFLPIDKVGEFWYNNCDDD